MSHSTFPSTLPRQFGEKKYTLTSLVDNLVLSHLEFGRGTFNTGDTVDLSQYERDQIDDTKIGTSFTIAAI